VINGNNGNIAAITAAFNAIFEYDKLDSDSSVLFSSLPDSSFLFSSSSDSSLVLSFLVFFSVSLSFLVLSCLGLSPVLDLSC